MSKSETALGTSEAYARIVAQYEAARKAEVDALKQTIAELQDQLGNFCHDGEYHRCCCTRYGKPHDEWCSVGVLLKDWE